LERYAKFISASGRRPCANPPFDAKLVRLIDSKASDTQAAIYRSDQAKEFVLAFPGTEGDRDQITNLILFKKAWRSKGIKCPGCRVHTGWATAWESVQDDVANTLKQQRAKFPGYKVVVAGHSLGAAVATLGYGSLKGLGFPVSAYVYGGPRVGNKATANYIDKLSGATDKKLGDFLRITRANDLVTQLPPKFLDFVHTRTEIWQMDNADGKQSAKTTFRCFGQEPKDCINSQGPWNHGVHNRYSNVRFGDPAHCR
jgi:predicted alpha/beta-fold hydrolase